MSGPGDRFRSSYYSKLQHMTSLTPQPPPIEKAASMIEDSKKSMMALSTSGTKPVAPPIMPAQKPETEEVSVVGEGEKISEKFEDPSNEGFALNYIEKTGHDLRMKFMHSLVMMKILVPLSMKPKTHQTGILSFPQFF